MTLSPYRILGEPSPGGIMIVGDHASNAVPQGLDLGIAAPLLETHIAWDLGVAAVAGNMVRYAGYWAFLGNVSRLVVDLNREADEEGVIPHHSDGTEIVANRLDPTERADRLARFYHPYHDRLEELISTHRPSLILSLHSFTPFLRSRPDEQRPWQIGVLYNRYEAASKLAVPYLEERGLVVGDQLPYSGKLLNASMNRHAEANNIPYIGVEMRQDMVADMPGQERFAQILAGMSHFVSEKLGLIDQKP